MSGWMVALVGVGFFLAGYVVKEMVSRADEKRWSKCIEEAEDDRHRFIYLWNVAACQLGAIRHMASSILDSGGGRGGLHAHSGPYRGDPSKLVEALEAIHGKTGEVLKSVAREVGCFSSLEEAAEWLKGWNGRGHKGEPHTYPMVFKHEEWDGYCWHIVYGSDVELSDVDRAISDIKVGHPVTMREAIDAIETIKMKREHGRRPMAVVNPCRNCQTGKPEPQCEGNCVHAER